MLSPFSHVPLYSTCCLILLVARQRGVDSEPQGRGRCRRTECDVKCARQAPGARMKRSGSCHWDTSGKSPPCNQVTMPSVPDHPETLWSFKCDLNGKAIYGHRWEGGTSALSSNYINRDTPDGTELYLADIKLMLHKCQLFGSGFLQVWSMGHFIEIVRECLLQLQIPGPTPHR